MKARILKNNKVVKVYRTNQTAIGYECSTVYLYKDYDGREYWSDELEIVPNDMPLSDDVVVTISKLREILCALVAEGVIEPITMSVDEIINQVKKSI